MSIPPPSVRAWAQRLLALETANSSASDSHLHVAVRVSEKLQISLTRFVGADGFSALQRRALALARTEVPSLQAVKITAQGRLEGIEEADKDGEAATAITAHLLGLLVTFIGEPLTLRLMENSFPNAGRMIVESEDL
jgi:hypothetical protein